MSNAQPAPSDQPWLTANAGSSTRCAAQDQQQPAMARRPDLGRKGAATRQPGQQRDIRPGCSDADAGKLQCSARSVRRRVTPSAMIETR